MLRLSLICSKRPRDEQERLAADDRAVPLVELRRDDQVHLAELVLEQHEDDPVSRSTGRWRATAIPAKATVLRCGASFSRSLGSTPGGRCGRSSVSGCTSIETLVVA